MKILGTVVLVLALVGGVSTYFLLGDGEQRATVSAARPAPDRPTPSSIVRHGETFELIESLPSGASLAAGDPRTVTLYAFEADHAEDPRCAFYDPQIQLVEETSEVVRIATYTYQLPTKGDGTYACGYASGEPSDDYEAMTVQLSEPLGSRRLLDARTGKEIGVLDPDYLPTPSYVPEGFTEEDFTGHFTAADGFMASRQYRTADSRSSIEVRVRALTAWGLSGKVLEHQQVAGVDGTVTEEDYQRCVSWSARSGLVSEVCSLGEEYLSPAELVRIASSIPAL